MDVLALFTPEAGRWRLRLFPIPSPEEVAGLSPEGECDGLSRPNYDLLDQLMLESRTAYRIRRHESGVTEVTVSSHGAAVLYRWVTAMIGTQ